MSQLKPFTPDHTPAYSDIVDLSARELVPIKVLDRHLVKKGNNAIPQVLVQWSGLQADSATWEDWYNIKERFPEVEAWGQASIRGGEGVTPPVVAATED